jgi:hypothetical protein
MSGRMESVRRYYGVPAYRGRTVVFSGFKYSVEARISISATTTGDASARVIQPGGWTTSTGATMPPSSTLASGRYGHD